MQQGRLSHRFLTLEGLTLGRLLATRWWYLGIGSIAILMILIVHPTVFSASVDYKNWESAILDAQVRHPLTPLVLLDYKPIGEKEDAGRLSHLDKLAFRLTIPILGKIFGTGMYSWRWFDFLSGLIFFPLLAVVLEGLTKDRLISAYLTLAMANISIGVHFFNDDWFGDGVAWLLLLVSISRASVWVIFSSIFVATFVDERALVASAGSFLFWIWKARSSAMTAASPASERSSWTLGFSVIAAWLCYFVLRVCLGWAFGLKTGTTMLLDPEILQSHLNGNLSYTVFNIFRGMWFWLILGAVTLLLNRQWLMAGGYLSLSLLLAFIAIVVVYDLERSFGYLLALFPLAFCLNPLSKERTLFLSRIILPLNMATVVIHKIAALYL